MALNRYKRLALKRARKLLVDRRYSYICFALNHVRKLSRTPALTFACQELELYVMDELAPWACLGVWQYERNIHHDSEQLRADRIAWIDWMLEEK